MRRWHVLALGAVALAVAVVVAIVWITSQDEPATDASPAPSGVPVEQLEEMSQSLVSQDPEVSDAWIASEVAQALREGTDDALLPEGSTITLDYTTWVESDGVAVVDAHIDGPTPMDSTLIVQLVDDRWLLLGTQED